MNVNYITDNIQTTTLPSGRTYHTPDGDFSSITTILGKTSPNLLWLEKWKARVGEEEAQRVSKLATDRGTLVHEYLEKYWNGLDIKKDLAKETQNVRALAESLISATSQNVTSVNAQEVPIWSNSLKFAGRIDMVGYWQGIPAIIDFKTSKKVKQVKEIKDYFLQCCGYAYAHNELYATNIKKIGVIIAVDNKTEAQIFESVAPVFLPDLKFRISQYNKLYAV